MDIAALASSEGPVLSVGGHIAWSLSSEIAQGGAGSVQTSRRSLLPPFDRHSAGRIQSHRSCRDPHAQAERSSFHSRPPTKALTKVGELCFACHACRRRGRAFKDELA